MRMQTSCPSSTVAHMRWDARPQGGGPLKGPNGTQNPSGCGQDRARSFHRSIGLCACVCGGGPELEQQKTKGKPLVDADVQLFRVCAGTV
jgi:hypothetical protein